MLALKLRPTVNLTSRRSSRPQLVHFSTSTLRAFNRGKQSYIRVKRAQQPHTPSRLLPSPSPRVRNSQRKESTQSRHEASDSGEESHETGAMLGLLMLAGIAYLL